MRADEHDRRPRDAVVRLRHRHDPQQHHRAGSEQPRRRRRNGAGREEHDHGRHDPEAFERAWPECGPPGVGRAPGESTASTSGSSSTCRSSASHGPCTSSESPGASTVSLEPVSLPLRCTARITSSPLSVTMPGKTRAHHRRSRRDDDLRPADAPVEEGVTRALAAPGMQHEVVVLDEGIHSVRRSTDDEHVARIEHVGELEAAIATPLHSHDLHARVCARHHPEIERCRVSVALIPRRHTVDPLRYCRHSVSA